MTRAPCVPFAGKCRQLAVGVLSALAAVACGSSGGSQKALRNNGAECNPYACECLPSCVCAFVATRPAAAGRAASCVGAPLCNTDSDCPESPFDAVCRVGVLPDGPNDLDGICSLVCSVVDDCPNGMDCVEGSCAFLLAE